MATKIYNTDTHKITELELIADGQDFLHEVIGGCNQDGCYYSEDAPETADYAMSDEDMAWWIRWTKREQVIIDISQSKGEDAIQAICDLAAKYGYDMELLQDKSEEYLGIIGDC